MILRPKNWSDFQHYKNRNPPWIRFHKRILDDRVYQQLPIASRALAPMLWLLASESKDPSTGEFDGSPEELVFRLRWPKAEIVEALTPLIHRGFFEVVQDASTVLADGLHDATPEERRDRGETEAEEIKLSTSLRSVEVGIQNSDPEPMPQDEKPKKPARNPVPYAQIVDLYHETLPMLPKVEKLTDARKGYLSARWHQDLTTLDEWRNFFDFVGRSTFLTGRAEANGGKRPFRADLEWITRPGNFAKIAEEKYHG